MLKSSKNKGENDISKLPWRGIEGGKKEKKTRFVKLDVWSLNTGIKFGTSALSVQINIY